MDYIGKIVELKAHGGTYKGTVIDRAQGKLTLQDGLYISIVNLTFFYGVIAVEFVDEDGVSTFLAQTRINLEDLDSSRSSFI